MAPGTAVPHAADHAAERVALLASGRGWAVELARVGRFFGRLGLTEPVELVDERRPAQVEQAGRLALVATCLFKTPRDQLVLDLRQHAGQVDAVVGDRHAREHERFLRLDHFGRQLRRLHLEDRAAERDGVLDGVLELTHISRPVECHQRAQGVLSECALRQIDGRVDFVLIDGLHTNEQLLRDFEAVAPHASADCVFVLHDVLNWHMLEAFHALDVGSDRERCILTRCPSGMGIVFPAAIDPSTREVIDAYCDETVDLPAFHDALGARPESPGPRLVGRLARGWRIRRVAMAKMYEMEGRADLAEEQIARALDEGARDAETQYCVAAHHIDRERWQDAETPLKRARELAPNWEVPPQQLGRIMREMGRDEEARGYLEEASRLRPEWAVAVFDLGLVVQTLEGDAAATVHFEQAHRLDPTWAPPLCELGGGRFRRGEDTAAIEYLEQCVALAPELAPAHHLLGLAKGRRDGPRAGVAGLERAVALDPACAFTRFDLGLVKRELHDHHLALQHLKRATTLELDWPPAWIEAAVCAAHLGQWNCAAKLLTRAAELGPTDPVLWSEIALSCRQAGDWAEGLNAFQHIRSLVPESRAAGKEIAICLRELGRPAESKAVLMEEIEARPEWAGAQFELGLTCEALQAWEQAERAFERAIELQPSWQQPRDALDGLCQRKAA